MQRSPLLLVPANCQKEYITCYALFGILKMGGDHLTMGYFDNTIDFQINTKKNRKKYKKSYEYVLLLTD
jgi:hypothetical protein